MPKLTPVNVKMPQKMIRELAKLSESTTLDRSALIRLAVSRLLEDEKHRSKREPRDI